MTTFMPTILYHAGCPDGTGAALAAYMKFGDDAVYLPVNYGQPVPYEKMVPGCPVYILDFSYPRPVLEDMKAKHPDLVVLDHHATAQEELRGLPFALFDMNSSGAVMAWRHFHPDTEPPELIWYIQDRDLWRFGKQYSYEVSLALRSYPMDFRTWHRMNLMNRVEKLMVEGVTIRRAVDQAVETMIERVRFAAFDTRDPKRPNITFLPDSEIAYFEESWKDPKDGVFIVPVVNATMYYSEAGERLLNKYPAKFAAYYFDRQEGVQQWGLRSREDFRCCDVAKMFGGGGHAQAAGFETYNHNGFVTRWHRTL